MSRWKCFKYDSTSESVDHWKEITTGGGCYALYFDGELGYIGSSVRVRSRISIYKIHYGYSTFIRTSFGDFRKVELKVFESIHFGDWAMKEIRLIHRLKPKYNRCNYSYKANR